MTSGGEAPREGDIVAVRYKQPLTRIWHVVYGWSSYHAEHPEWYAAIVVLERRADFERWIKEAGE